MEGIINRSGEFVAASTSGAVQHGTIHKTTGAVQGTWVLPDDTRGTLTGGRAAQPQKPAVVTLAAAGVTAGAATLNGTVNPNGSDAAYLFQYGPTAAYGWQTAALSAGAGTAAVPVSAAVAGLAPGTPYHFRLEATNAAGTTYGNGLAFTTAAVAPTVVTLAPSPLGPDRAAGGGTVVADGGAAVTARGVCWGPAENPTVADSKTVDGSGLGGFSSLVTGLTPGVPYHVRAYATNGAGTAYGDDHAFSTQAQAPGVVTGAASALTETSALLRATVNPNGDPTDWHFEYGETDAYGLTTPEEDAGGGTAPVAVSAAVEGLPPGSACHYRVVAVNGLGTSYGADRVLSTEILYVAPGGQCGGKSPCYISIQAALDAAGDGAAIRVASGEYAENLAPGEAKTLTLSGGWDAAFDAAAGLTVVDGGSLPPLTLESGALAVERLVLR